MCACLYNSIDVCVCVCVCVCVFFSCGCHCGSDKCLVVARTLKRQFMHMHAVRPGYCSSCQPVYKLYYQAARYWTLRYSTTICSPIQKIWQPFLGSINQVVNKKSQTKLRWDIRPHACILIGFQKRTLSTTLIDPPPLSLPFWLWLPYSLCDCCTYSNVLCRLWVTVRTFNASIMYHHHRTTMDNDNDLSCLSFVDWLTDWLTDWHTLLPSRPNDFPKTFTCAAWLIY